MRRPLVLLVLLAIFLPVGSRALLPLVHEPCAGPDLARTSECPVCLAIAHPTAALVPAPAELPRATFVEVSAVEEPPPQPSLPDRQPPPARGPPSA